MITKSQAMAAKYRQEFHHTTLKNFDKTPARCRVNGKCKTWKTRPSEFQLPVKHGLKSCFYITEVNAEQWTDLSMPPKSLTTSNFGPFGAEGMFEARKKSFLAAEHHPADFI